MLQYSVIHSLLTRHGIAVCALLLLVCQLGCEIITTQDFNKKPTNLEVPIVCYLEKQFWYFCLRLHEWYHITWNCVFLQWLPQVRTLCSIKIILFSLAQVGFAAGACQTWNDAKFLVLSPNFSSMLTLQIQLLTFPGRGWLRPELDPLFEVRNLCYLCDMKGYVSIINFN